MEETLVVDKEKIGRELEAHILGIAGLPGWTPTWGRKQFTDSDAQALLELICFSYPPEDPKSLAQLCTKIAECLSFNPNLTAHQRKILLSELLIRFMDCPASSFYHQPPAEADRQRYIWLTRFVLLINKQRLAQGSGEATAKSDAGKLLKLWADLLNISLLKTEWIQREFAREAVEFLEEIAGGRYTPYSFADFRDALREIGQWIGQALAAKKEEWRDAEIARWLSGGTELDESIRRGVILYCSKKGDLTDGYVFIGELINLYRV